VEQLADQTAVHRKKFEFALSQLRTFFKHYSNHSPDSRLTPTEITASLQLHQEILTLRDLVSQHLLQTWSLPTIQNPSNFVLEQLQQIFQTIHNSASILDITSSSFIDPHSPQWAQFHILDLRAIHASFTQYLTAPDLDKELSRSIEDRLVSIGQTFENSTLPGPARIFSPIPVHYQSWKVNYSDFDEIKMIGSGVSASVHLCRYRKTGQEDAIKKFKYQRLNGSKLQSFQREVAVLATASHPALLKLIGATDTSPFCIITQWMPNGSLYHDLHVYHRLDGTGRTIAAYDIARGMRFLHSRQIVHRDMKSLNILLDSDNRVRICDFGFSRQASDDSPMTQGIGTPHWMAPELLIKNTNYTAKIDVYAFGIVLWELATAQTPYEGMEAAEIIAKVLQEDLRPTLPIDVNPGLSDLIIQCWDRNPEFRPNFEEIVRRIRSGEAVMNGTVIEVFRKYVNESDTSGEQLTRSVES
jgi:hypothetical protein